MKSSSVVLCFVLMAGCKSSAPNDGYAIDFTIVIDSSVMDSDVARIVELDLTVSGSETATSKIPATGKFVNRSAGLRYKPAAQSVGSDTFSMRAVDAAGKLIASGKLDVALKPGTQVITLTLYGTAVDGGAPIDMNPCGNGVVDPGETCDPGPGSPMPCPKSVADCDDANDCTTDGLSGMGCTAACTHTPVMNGSGCMVRSGDAGTTGVCQSGACCTGCLKNGACVSGATDATACGSGGNACFDCTTNGATCSGGQCTGCSAASCGARVCGTSSCGYNCGACPDQCVNGGTLNHFACAAAGTCTPNGGTNCGLYVTCANSSTCNTSCTGDGDCINTAWCNQTTKKCESKSGLGGPCSAETTGDRECAAPYVCSWASNGASGYCTMSRCTGCQAATASGMCNGFVKYGTDPRHHCPYIDVCNQAFCGGAYRDCDDGHDAAGIQRPCGAVTCASTTSSGVTYGKITGAICSNNLNGNSTCQQSATANCVPSVYDTFCTVCNAANTGCDDSKVMSCF